MWKKESTGFRLGLGNGREKLDLSMTDHMSERGQFCLTRESAATVWKLWWLIASWDSQLGSCLLSWVTETQSWFNNTTWMDSEAPEHRHVKGLQPLRHTVGEKHPDGERTLRCFSWLKNCSWTSVFCSTWRWKEAVWLLSHSSCSSRSTWTLYFTRLQRFQKVSWKELCNVVQITWKIWMCSSEKLYFIPSKYSFITETFCRQISHFCLSAVHGLNKYLGYSNT